jgi:hypothetical protein
MTVVAVDVDDAVDSVSGTMPEGVIFSGGVCTGRWERGAGWSSPWPDDFSLDEEDDEDEGGEGRRETSVDGVSLIGAPPFSQSSLWSENRVDGVRDARS